MSEIKTIRIEERTHQILMKVRLQIEQQQNGKRLSMDQVMQQILMDIAPKYGLTEQDLIREVPQQ